ncbi:site-2 protease family protein [Gloeocapsopsis dulcis]|uniref:Site-2 protease family protein n=1 Tax=Gloeocapsopsis dulcis AAB1 = 1H9 TaxID=1433147 RepID=A0A6N8FZ91_9CHRO|nr:site-2 protease family protein [Gloeocapsopsis dulcis]MUL38271.1 site-2 protease family protein [Gloeocapsopsis dulcis AAB1 = 1H9]WNN89338.1 site-2 protease family protein [Gloeocapsopsis dulcis]
MSITSESSIVGLIVLAAFTILGWGFYRARPYGKLGVIAWLQSVVLMAPWLLFFGLFATGIYINIVGILFLLVASAAVYIFLGRQLRAAGQDAILRSRATERLANADATQNDSQTEDIPPQLQPEVVSIAEEDLGAIRNIFGIDTFFATETIPYQEGIIFKGNLRGEPEAVFQKLSSNLQQQLGDRYRLFLVENLDGKPVVIVLPSRNDPQPTNVAQTILAVVLLITTIATCLEAGGILLGFDFLTNLQRFQEPLPIAAGILAVLLTHELGHRVLARRYQVRLSPPFFLPTLQIGAFGAITRFQSILPNRQVLFDVAFAGPAFGGILSFTLLVLGFVLSRPESLFQVPTEFFQGSILVGAIARAILGSALQQNVVAVHPLTVIGWLGLVITALNLMPAGQLDGGRIVQAIYGRKTAGRTTIATLIVLAIASFANPLALYWAVVIVFLQRDLERPSQNELTEPDDARAALGLLALFLMVATLLPLTPALAGRLGIGG